jgi:glycosyltransferase involved in cell wall biosynthesis
MSDRVSIIIPAFNAAEFLQRTVDSAVNQTYENLEIIIVDDGSTDSTPKIARACAEKNKIVKYFRKENEGVASARNYGIKVANGRFVAFLDADDLWHPEKISNQMSALKEVEGGADACFSLHREIGLDDRVMRTNWFWPAIDFTLSPHIVLHPVGNGSSILVKRAIAIEVGGFDEDYVLNDAGGCEDLDFELKIAARYPIRCVPQYHVGYRVYEGNMSSDRVRMVRAMNMVITRQLARNPQLSILCKNLAMAKVYEYSLGNLISHLHFKAGIQCAHKLLRSNPSALRNLALNRWPRSLARRLLNVLRNHIGFAPFHNVGPLFLELDPNEAGPDELWTEKRILYEKLFAQNAPARKMSKQKPSQTNNSIALLERIR